MLNIFRGLVFLLLTCASVAHAADTGWLTSPQNDHARVRFQAEKENDRIDALLSIELASGWKTYWRSPGEGGVAPQIVWHNGEQAQWYWPVPSRFEISGLTTQGYHQRVVIPIIITAVPGDLLDGTLTLSTCSNVCLLTDYRLRLDLSQPATAGFQEAFAQAMRTIPADKGVSDDLAAHRVGSDLVITATTVGEWKNPAIFFDPMEGGIIAGAPRLRTEGASLKVTVPVTDEWGEEPATLAGKALSLVLTNGAKAQQTSLTIGADLAPTSTVSLWKMLLFALIGGLILNLMPCVLPVMGMKLSAVLQSGSDKRAIGRRFLATSAGILTSFVLLALMVTILKLTGASLGWGIQFQNPWFIGVMVLVMLTFSASLFGWFEFRLPSAMTTSLATHGGNGLSGHFWQGAFATLLATPCSAPFLGTAVAVALTASLPTLWGLFIALGLGMSLPWLLVALRPGLALRLPRPGRWMNILRRLLGVMMLGSAIWLATLLLPHLGLAGQSSAKESVNWQPLSEQAIEEALAQHKRVFIDVTADWCITCKVNKYNVLHKDDVQAALQQPDVVALRGDWTLPSEAITEFLKKRGQVAVPYNQIYGPGLPEGQALPTLLTRDAVLQTLNDAKGVTP